MKKIIIGLALCTLPAMLIARDCCCSRTLDALNNTLQRVSNEASATETSLNQYQQDCCESCADILRQRTPPSQCLCAMTPITASVSLSEPGSYCLANDITGVILTDPGIQVVIDLKGHTVNGSVYLSDHGYVHNGSITENLSLGSSSRAELLTVGGTVQGISSAQNVVLSDVVLTHTSVGNTLANFESIMLDRITFAVEGELYSSTFSVNNVVNLTMRDCYVLGSLQVDISATPVLETFSIYDSHIMDELYVYVKDSLSSFAVWDSIIGRLYTTFQTFDGSPSFLLHGLASSNVYFTSVSQHPNTRIFVDECDGGRFIFQRVSNIHCQNTTANASANSIYTAFAPVHLESCQNVLFQDVMTTNTLLDMVTADPGFYIADSRNLLFKNCFSVAEMGTAYSVAFTSTNINFDHCVAKGSFTGFWAQVGTSGSVCNCIADGCGSMGFSNADGAATSIVYAGNVACFNDTNYSQPTATAPYYDAAYTVTAGSWRNINI